MIDTLDDELVGWLEEVAPGARVVLDEIARPGGETDIGLHLLDLGDMPPARGPDRPPLQVLVSYLVTTAGKDAKEAHRRLGDLLFAAMAHARYDVRLALPSSFWVAAGMPPRASFVLTAPLRKPLEVPQAKPVLEPLVVTGVGIHPLSGVVLGPNDVPISDALIDIPALALSTRTDGRGRFRFDAIPGGESSQHLRVRAKAREFPFTIDSADRDGPVALRIDPSKG